MGIKMASNLSKAILKTEYPRGLPAKFQGKSFSTWNSLSPVNPLDPFLSNLLEEVLSNRRTNAECKYHRREGKERLRRKTATGSRDQAAQIKE